MVVDIGGGTSEVAVISMGEIVVETSLRARAATTSTRRSWPTSAATHNLAIGQPTAEEIKIAARLGVPDARDDRGRGARPRAALGPPAHGDARLERHPRGARRAASRQIVDAVRETLDQTPPELSSDILIHGILLAGGGALLHGLAERLESETSMPTRVADSPLTCVAVGAGQALEEFEAIARRQVLARRHPRSRPRMRR